MRNLFWTMFLPVLLLLGCGGDFVRKPTKTTSNPSGGAYYLVCDPALISGAIGEMAPWRAYWFKAGVECDLIMPAP